jgi:hypothetical protein
LTKIISILSFFLFSLISCTENNSKRNEKLKFGEDDADVIVTVEIVNLENIENIEFFDGNGKSYLVSSEKLKNVCEIKFGKDGGGEGTFTLCIYSKVDTICTNHYVEGGYRPRLKIVDYSIFMIEPTGSSY